MSYGGSGSPVAYGITGELPVEAALRSTSVYGRTPAAPLTLVAWPDWPNWRPSTHHRVRQKRIGMPPSDLGMSDSG